MLTTLTSKGQLTLPKPIRDKLGLDAGDKLEFTLLPDDTMTVRAVRANASSVRALLKSSADRRLSVEQMDRAIAQHLRRKHAPRGK